LIEFVDLRPGDWVDGGQVHREGASGDGAEASSRVAADAARDTVLAKYAVEPRPALDAEGFADLLGKVRQAVAARATPTDSLHVVLVLRDYPTQAVDVRVTGGAVAVEAIDAADVASRDPEAVVETRSDLIASTMRSPFGRDLITIGYGA